MDHFQVIHFKRFRQHQMKGPQAAKLTTMVTFPMHGFDMSPHLAKTEGSGGSIGPSDSKYDLYAVCYHQGNTLETGHYTAACCNPYDQQWYRFDDQRVTHVPKERVEEDIINEEAYMLFYQRRKVDGSECSGSSTSSGEHWISRIAPNVLPKVVVEVVKEEEKETLHPVVVTVEKKVEEEIEPDKSKKEGESEVVSVEKLIAEDVIETGQEIVETTVTIEHVEEVEQEKTTEESLTGNERIDEEVKEELKIVEDVEKAKKVAEDEKKTDAVVGKEIERDVVVVRKSSPIPIQRSSAPLNFSQAFDDSVTTTTSSRHSSSSYTGRDLDSAVSYMRASSSCSKDTFMFMDRYRHRPHHSGRSLIDEDGLLGASSHSLWVGDCELAFLWMGT